MNDQERADHLAEMHNLVQSNMGEIKAIHREMGRRIAELYERDPEDLYEFGNYLRQATHDLESCGRSLIGLWDELA